jgi:peroxiredoxin
VLALAVVVVLVLAIAVVTAVAIRSGDDGGTSAPGRIVVPPPGAVNVGDVAPDFTLPTLDGDSVQLSDFRGRPVVLNFWASFCKPCREEFPLFRRSLARRGDVALLGVNTMEALESDGRSFADDQHATWPSASDARSRLAAAYGVSNLPQTLFIDAHGVVRDRIFGEVDRPLLRQGLAAVEPSATPPS